MLAAQKAGFGTCVTRPNDRILLISEPEAAAITALQKYTINPLGAPINASSILIPECIANILLGWRWRACL